MEGKSDKAGAATLARLALSFRLKASNVPNSRQRELRTYVRLIRDADLTVMRTGQRLQSHLLGAGITLYRNVGFHTQRGQHALALMIEGKPAAEILKVVASSLARKDVPPEEAEQGIKGLPEATKIFIIQQQSLSLLATSQAD